MNDQNVYESSEEIVKKLVEHFFFEKHGGLTGLYHLGYFGMFSGITLCMAKGSKVKKGGNFQGQSSITT